MKHSSLFISVLVMSLFFCSCSVLRREGAPAKVMTGLDVLEREHFARLEGSRIALISNHSALNQQGRHILDLMLASGNVNVVKIFSPEHGFPGTAQSKIADHKDEKSGLVIHSLFGDTLRPTPEMLKGVDTMVFDIQDIGTRFYTYISTMAMCMEEAKKNDCTFIVLDRPNPITGLKVDGPLPDRELLRSFTSYFPLPVMHGMTIGELAKMFNEEFGIQCDLEIVQMEGWRRTMYWDDTGLPWVNPSPNIRNVMQEILYPGVALTEGANVTVGRGTDTPFEWLGTPWIDAEELAKELEERDLPGIAFETVQFIPEGSKFANETCNGVRFVLTNRKSFMPVVTGVNILDALYKLYPDKYEIDDTYPLIGKKAIIEMIKNRAPMELVIRSWQNELANFNQIRLKHILYKQ